MHVTSQSLHNLLLCGKSVAKAAAVTMVYVEIDCSVKPDAVYKTRTTWSALVVLLIVQP